MKDLYEIILPILSVLVFGALGVAAIVIIQLAILSPVILIAWLIISVL